MLVRSCLYPPTRREVTLVVFAFTVFILSYNLETSLQIVGVSPANLRSSYLSTFGLAKDPGFEPDGRRPVAWRDDLEKMIVGEWEWKEGHIAEVEHAQDDWILGGLAGSGQPSSYIYNPDGMKKASRSATRYQPGVGVKKGVTVHEQFVRWTEDIDIPETTAIAHVPGFTILEKLIVLNGTFYIVTDNPKSLPSLGSIASAGNDTTQPPRQQDWRIVSKEEAKAILPGFGGRLQGTTWLTTDPANSQDPYTLFSLFRTNSYLTVPHKSHSFTSPSGLRIITPGGAPSSENVTAPIRMIFPSVPTFSSPHVPPPPGSEDKAHPPMRVKSYNGLHPMLLKTVFPTMGILYTEDWEDLSNMHAPYVFDRIIVADSSAANRGRNQWSTGWLPPYKSSSSNPNSAELRKRADGDEDKPMWAAPFIGFSNIPQGWWTPARTALLSYLRLPADVSGANEAKKKSKLNTKPIVTYVSMQDEPKGAGFRLRQADHDALINGLEDLKKNGVLAEVHTVKGNGTSEDWNERMNAIARSQIVLGPFGPQLADSLFMPVPPPSNSNSQLDSSNHNSGPAPILMEFFPGGTFRRDQEFAVRSIGIRYVAWWNDRKFSGDLLPPVLGFSNGRTPNLDDREVALDPKAVLAEIKEEAARFKASL
ncbi:hypothetical protein ABKN59_007826 [Abortiporus biennis]